MVIAEKSNLVRIASPKAKIGVAKVLHHNLVGMSQSLVVTGKVRVNPMLSRYNFGKSGHISRYSINALIAILLSAAIFFVMMPSLSAATSAPKLVAPSDSKIATTAAPAFEAELKSLRASYDILENAEPGTQFADYGQLIYGYEQLDYDWSSDGDIAGQLAALRAEIDKIYAASYSMDPNDGARSLAELETDKINVDNDFLTKINSESVRLLTRDYTVQSREYRYRLMSTNYNPFADLLGVGWQCALVCWNEAASPYTNILESANPQIDNYQVVNATYSGSLSGSDADSHAIALFVKNTYGNFTDIVNNLQKPLDFSGDDSAWEAIKVRLGALIVNTANENAIDPILTASNTVIDEYVAIDNDRLLANTQIADATSAATTLLGGTDGLSAKLTNALTVVNTIKLGITGSNRIGFVNDSGTQTYDYALNYVKYSDADLASRSWIVPQNVNTDGTLKAAIDAAGKLSLTATAPVAKGDYSLRISAVATAVNPVKIIDASGAFIDIIVTVTDKDVVVESPPADGTPPSPAGGTPISAAGVVTSAGNLVPDETADETDIAGVQTPLSSGSDSKNNSTKNVADEDTPLAAASDDGTLPTAIIALIALGALAIIGVIVTIVIRNKRGNAVG